MGPKYLLSGNGDDCGQLGAGPSGMDAWMDDACMDDGCMVAWMDAWMDGWVMGPLDPFSTPCVAS